MAHDGEFIIDDEGYFLHSGPDGRWDVCEKCCPGEPCPGCPDSMPKKVSAVLSGISFCTGCISHAELGQYKLTVPPTTPNGTFELTQDPENPCVFNFTREDSGTWTRYPFDPFDPTPDCDDEPLDEFIISSFHIRYQILSATSAILTAWYTSTFTFGPGGTANLEVFKQIVSRGSEDNCLPESFPVNEIDSCIYSAAANIGYDGAGTLEAA